MPILDSSFDPFATHPFTNNSGIIPDPPRPSQYPIPIPSPRNSSFSSRIPQYHSNPASPASPSTTQSSPPLQSPKPQGSPPSASPPARTNPIFVPFRRETSSPDLVLKKTSPSQSIPIHLRHIKS